MTTDNALIHAYILNGSGGGKRVSWPAIGSWDQSQGMLWLHFNYTEQKAQHWLIQNSGLPRYIIQAMLSEETRPRTIVSTRGVLMILRGVNLNPGHNPKDMVSIRIWIDEHRIITTRSRLLMSINDLTQSIDSGHGPASPTDFLLQLNDHLLNRIGCFINELDDEVEALDQKMEQTDCVTLRSGIADIRRQAVSIRRYLSPQREALYQLQIQAGDSLDSQKTMHLRESTDRIIRYIEDLDSARDRAAITQEELSSRISEQMDKRMFVLSVAAVIFLPLSFITGLLGINVPGIPGSHSHFGFLFVCLFLLILGVGMLWVFKRQKWM